ncbi:Zinc finger protein 594 [Myotis brandtii]|uniref:Zinc finger protein 594 n=1 Tax=Myotis brandtii TaxID=109478 RepID=S7NK59_MYOBR|nr:Zinc finger protein 594 [Myotis brandtii]
MEPKDDYDDVEITTNIRNHHLKTTPDSETRNKMKDRKAKMKISEEKDSARVVSGRLQRQISQECGLVETSDLEHRSLRHWGERGCECNEGGKILSARGRSHRYEVCGQSFKQKSEVTEHEKIDNIKKTYDKIYTGENPYQCKECGKVFRQCSLLNQHLRIHNGEKPYECKECGKPFIRHTAFLKHQRLHTGEKVKESEKTFSKDELFREEQRIHQEEKAYQCGRTFQGSSDLITHHLTHMGEKPYECKECGETFHQGSDLMKHHRINSGEKLTFSSDLIKHYCVHTGEKSYGCLDCGKAFNQNSHFI